MFKTTLFLIHVSDDCGLLFVLNALHSLFDNLNFYWLWIHFSQVREIRMWFIDWTGSSANLWYSAENITELNLFSKNWNVSPWSNVTNLIAPVENILCPVFQFTIMIDELLDSVFSDVISVLLCFFPGERRSFGKQTHVNCTCELRKLPSASKMASAVNMYYVTNFTSDTEKSK